MPEWPLIAHTSLRNAAMSKAFPPLPSFFCVLLFSLFLFCSWHSFVDGDSIALPALDGKLRIARDLSVKSVDFL
jgi:hypothetical protein